MSMCITPTELIAFLTSRKFIVSVFNLKPIYARLNQFNRNTRTENTKRKGHFEEYKDKYQILVKIQETFLPYFVDNRWYCILKNKKSERRRKSTFLLTVKFPPELTLRIQWTFIVTMNLILSLPSLPSVQCVWLREVGVLPLRNTCEACNSYIHTCVHDTTFSRQICF